jgi:hypothetical protein
VDPATREAIVAELVGIVRSARRPRERVAAARVLAQFARLEADLAKVAPPAPPAPPDPGPLDARDALADLERSQATKERILRQWTAVYSPPASEPSA